MTGEKTIYVYADWEGPLPLLIGRLYVGGGKGKELFSFEYTRSWLEKAEMRTMLDPDLGFYGGRQYVPFEKSIFGIFADSCPDRWGRTLMRRREAVLARAEGRKPRTLLESDYLLGVFDASRMGALRFSEEKGGSFLAFDEKLAIPPWATLRRLENASLAFENDENMLETKWLDQLLAPGSSLGGARPKATVLAPDGALWIAKFPSRQDEFDSGAWEMTVHLLADRCGLQVPEARLEKFSKSGSTFLVKRFDRDKKKRIHFASAMTLLGKTDGASGDGGVGYLDLVSFIRANGAMPKEDLRELWRRVVFSIAVSNTGDHLRNHGFLLSGQGWRLSPLYDVNPDIYGGNLSLNITPYDSTLDFELALETASYYGISDKEAYEGIEKIKKTVRDNWISVAGQCGLKRDAIEYMRPAFAINES